MFMKKKVKSTSKLKGRINTAKKIYGTAKWIVGHKDLIIKGVSTAKGFADKKKASSAKV